MRGECMAKQDERYGFMCEWGNKKKEALAVPAR